MIKHSDSADCSEDWRWPLWASDWPLTPVSDLTWKMRTLKLFLQIRWAWLASSFFTWAPCRSIFSRTYRSRSWSCDRSPQLQLDPPNSPPSSWQTVCGSCPAVCWQCWTCGCDSWTVWSYQPGFLWPHLPSPPDAPEEEPHQRSRTHTAFVTWRSLSFSLSLSSSLPLSVCIIILIIFYMAEKEFSLSKVYSYIFLPLWHEEKMKVL